MIRRLIALQLAYGISLALIAYYALTEPDRPPVCRCHARLRQDERIQREADDLARRL